jgi:predicted transcriptional regulator
MTTVKDLIRKTVIIDIMLSFQNKDEVIVSEVTRKTGYTGSNIHNRMALLMQEGFLTSEKIGRWRPYKLTNKGKELYEICVNLDKLFK